MIDISQVTKDLLQENAKILRQRDKDDIFMQQWIKMNREISTASKSGLMKAKMMEKIDNMDVKDVVTIVSDIINLTSDDCESTKVDIGLQDRYTCQSDSEVYEFGGHNITTLLDSVVQSCADRMVDETYRAKLDTQYQSNIDVVEVIDRLPVASLNLIGGKLNYRRNTTECDDEMLSCIDSVLDVVDSRYYDCVDSVDNDCEM